MDQPFLRSVNIQYDAAFPERIAHFRPTSKSMVLVDHLLGRQPERAVLVTAPYGTGKSIAGAYALHLIENKEPSRQTLQTVEQRLAEGHADFAGFAKRRRIGRKRGLVLVVHGYARDLPTVIKDAAQAAFRQAGKSSQVKALEKFPVDTMEEGIALLAEVRVRAEKAGLDRILIIWDEFGKHLESLVAEGKTANILHIQMLAEFVSRDTRLPVTLGLLMHQGLMQYAGNVPQTVQQEWAKVEGRFHHLEYIDDSKEVYRLIADVVALQDKGRRPKKSVFNEQASAIKKTGLFKGWTTKDLSALLHDAYPLEPASLYLLPRISSRLAQHERTLFSFLHAHPLEISVSPDALYDYFSPQMRADTAAGGSHRQWLETESALSKVSDSEEAIRALKTVCLLSLGISGERGRAGRSLVEAACMGYGDGGVACINDLIKRKLLLHRKNNDEVTLWHGTDVDLQGKLADAKARASRDFDLQAFLAKEAPPPAWRPVEHNAETGVQRYFTGHYIDLYTLKSLEACPSNFEPLLHSDTDGLVLYVLPENRAELNEARCAVKKIKKDRVLAVLPSEHIPVREAATEVACLLEMQKDKALMSEDPLVLPELRQMTDDARAHLQTVLERLTWPGEGRGEWFRQGGKRLQTRSLRELRMNLSFIMNEVFSKTPAINNEVIVRKKPTGVMVNARKKLIMGILERSGEEKLGLEGNFPDSSIFRTVFLNTGLYAKGVEGKWWYCDPKQIDDEGLAEVWKKVQAFCTTPSDAGKSFTEIIEELKRPPYGLRAGVMPVLFAAGLVAFPGAIALRRKGEYIPDILPSDIEEIFKNPEDHKLVVLKLSSAQKAYLRQLHKQFSSVGGYEVPSSDLIRLCYDALRAWVSQLPVAARNTQRLGRDTMRFRDAILAGGDPVDLFLERLPQAVGVDKEQAEDLSKAIAAHKRNLEGLVGIYVNEAVAAVEKTFRLDDDPGKDVQAVVADWGKCFSDEFTQSNRLDGVAKGFLMRVKTSYDTPALLVDALSSHLLGKTTSAWDDGTHYAFERELQALVRKIEETAVHAPEKASLKRRSIQGLTTLAEGRMREWAEKISLIAGDDAARKALEQLLADLRRKESQDGPLA